MNLSLVTPDKSVFEGEIVSVKLPGSDGSFEVLENHAPLVSSLSKGTVRIKTSSSEEKFVIDSGVVEIANNKVIILAESLIE